MNSLTFLSLPLLPKIRTSNSTLPTLNNNKSNSISRLVLESRCLKTRKTKKIRGGGAVCYVASFSPQTLHWISAISSAVLMLSKGTAIHKSFVVPLFALQAPATVISWCKGEYGIWTAFLALLVRLFYFIPGELELPFLTLLIVIVAPYQAMNLRGSQPGSIISLAIAGYLAFQHFSRAGSLRRAFDQVSFIATLAIICITVVPMNNSIICLCFLTFLLFWPSCCFISKYSPQDNLLQQELLPYNLLKAFAHLGSHLHAVVSVLLCPLACLFSFCVAYHTSEFYSICI